MLKSLSIRNYALISELDIDFGSGLTTLTGETGAGKSILLGALALVLGNRADSSVLLDASKKCLVEAVFSFPIDLDDFFRRNDLDQETEIIVRREISAQGKSRAFINDTPVNLQILKELGDRLVDIHSQHQNLILARHDYAVEVIDRYGKLGNMVFAYRQIFDQYRDTGRALEKLREELAKAKADQDYIDFQLNQLDEARLLAGEQEQLESEQEILSHAGEIHQRLLNALERINGDHDSLLNGLKQVLSDLQAIRGLTQTIEEPRSRIESLYIELTDLTRELETWSEKVEQDPDRLRFIEQRLDLIYSLQQKHQLKSVEDLISYSDKLRAQLASIETSDEKLKQLQADYDILRTELGVQAGKLSEARQKAVPGFEKAIAAHLKELGIPNARFEVSWTESPDFQLNGRDALRFLFSANKNQRPEEISRVASGGEISRLMLAVKSLISDSLDIPTMIFDEIDAGVSGEIAHKMGNMIRAVSSGRQVINITHLPQVAALGDHHYMVYKYDNDTSTQTAIRILEGEGRVNEVAKMLSGDRISEEAIKNARVLLGK